MSAVRKRALETEYQQIRDMLQRDEREAMDALDKEMESGNSKLNTLIKKFNQNIERMSSTRDEITNLLAKSHSLDFLQVRTRERWPEEFWEDLTCSETSGFKNVDIITVIMSRWAGDLSQF